MTAAMNSGLTWGLMKAQRSQLISPATVTETTASPYRTCHALDVTSRSTPASRFFAAGTASAGVPHPVTDYTQTARHVARPQEESPASHPPNMLARILRPL